MEIKTSELTGAALDWAVAKCVYGANKNIPAGFPAFSEDWAQAGPIIDREGITVSKEQGEWSAYFRDNLFNEDGTDCWQVGPTPLVAAMRCFVASKLGAEVDVPEELLL